MVLRDQYIQPYDNQGATPKGREHEHYRAEAHEDESRFDEETRDGTTVLMQGDQSTIRTQEDMSLATREPAGGFPAWSPALAAQKPPETITATSPRAQKEETQQSKGQPMDFMNNDNSFHVVASLLVDKFEETLKKEASFIKVSEEDKEQINSILPESARENFVAALRYRLNDAPEFSRLPLHTVTRNCSKLGLDRLDTQNILFAAPGTVVKLEFQAKTQTNIHGTSSSHSRSRSRNIDTNSILQDNDGQSTVRSEYDEEYVENMARQQILAELREASTLMAESVTPEAAQFWKKQVVELQSKLRSLHENRGDRSTRSSARSVASVETAELMRQNERLLASLQNNTGYVPPRKADYVPPYTPKSHITQEPKVNESALPSVHVVAPADLPGGYTFEAEIDNRRFLATVPTGGVKKGETFTSVMRDIEQKGLQVPTGRWRDGLFDIFKHGTKHPLVLLSFFCPPVALAQIMTRLSLDFLGRPANLPERGIWSTWGTMNTIIGMWAFMNFIVISGWWAKLSGNVALSFADIASMAIVNLALFVYTVEATARTRASVRKYSGIEEKPIFIGPKKFENGQDYLLATFAMPLTIAQMGRHTVSYEDQEAFICTRHGLAKEVTIADLLTCNDPGIFGCDNPYSEMANVEMV